MSPESLQPRVQRLAAGLLLVAITAVAFRFWTSLCFFPLPEWNSVRLTPSFMLRAGQNPYPTIDGGPLTTWIYGPIPLLINLPVTLATDAVVALLAAGVVNLLCTVAPVALAIGTATAPPLGISRVDRVWTLLLCLALWPNTSLQYLQPDNIAVAFGLLSNLLLSRARGQTPPYLLLAALCAALAVWSKQTALGLVLAQLLWLIFTGKSDAAIRYAGASLACGLVLGGIFVGWFGFENLWLNLVSIPGRLPLCPDFAERTLQLAKPIVGDVLVPAIGLVVFRRALWKRDSPWLLPALTWLCLLPMGVISIYKIGGAANSLNGYLYLLPPAAVALVAWLKRVKPRTAPAWTVACIIAILTQQLRSTPLLPLRPLTTHLHEATYLAKTFPHRIYFPWHPLITWFSEQRFYHAEDGLYTRHVARFEPTPEIARKNLPPLWSMTAIPGWREDGVFRHLQPASAQRSFFGKWTLYSWPPAATAAAGAAADTPALEQPDVARLDPPHLDSPHAR